MGMGAKLASVENAETIANKQRWTSIIIAYVTVFLMFVQNSMYWTSLWPYLTKIDSSANETFFGFLIAAYSLGTALSAPLLGYWSNRIKATRPTILVGVGMNVVGNLLYVFIEAFPSNRKEILLLARFITGCGAGSRGPLNAYVSMATTMEERSKAISYMSATFALGGLCGPGIQAALVGFGYPGQSVGPFRWNMYTAPGYLSIVACLIVTVLLCTSFREYHISVDKKLDDGKDTLKPFDMVAAAVCCCSRFAVLFCVLYDDTIGSPFTMAMFDWSTEEAVLYNGIIQTVSGVISFFGNIFVGTFVLRFVRERTAMITGHFLFILYYVASFSYPAILPPLNEARQNFPQSGGSTGLGNATTTAPGYACLYSWCSYTTRIQLWQYILAYFFLTLAFPCSFAPTNTLYSKILGPRRQGLFQGISVASGSIAATISPVIVSSLFEYYGPRVAWTMGMALVAVAITILGTTFKRLVPYHAEPVSETSDADNTEDTRF